MRADFCDPGFQKREDLHSGIRAAASGGFVGVYLLPHTDPVVQTQSVVAYIRHKATNPLVRVQPMGALSANLEGRILGDMLQMHEAGVSVFTHGNHATRDTHLLLQALRYVKHFEGLVVEMPHDFYLSRVGSMHEGRVSVRLGLQGIPALAEEAAVHRGLSLLAYTGSRLHFSCLSTAASLALIAKAKRKGLPVTCDVSLHHLLFDDTALLGFDTQHKVYPPYRDARDRRALLRGIKNHVVDAIVSAHTPQHVEDKEEAFLSAAYGAISLPTAFSVLNRIKKDLPLALSLPKLYRDPYHVVRVPPPTVRVGEPACFTVFDSASSWRFHANNNHSQSVNSPFYGQIMKGRVLATVRDASIFTP